MSPTLLSAPALSDSLQFNEFPHPLCRAIVVIPVRNEEHSLADTLQALRKQQEIDGSPLNLHCFEVHLLLNNCTDKSAFVARRYTEDHPDFHLHIFECNLRPELAHVGTARRALMDAACIRLQDLASPDADLETCTAILSTDADTLVAPDWIARNLMAIQRGADVVGGVIHLFPEDLECLDSAMRSSYERDRQRQSLSTRLESLLDPDPFDPWPRHMDHFGASLACTPDVYWRSGGLPPVSSLEDVAFIDALRRIGAKIRHEPKVCVYTSARLDGRAEVGLSGQLRIWRNERQAGLPHMVESAEWLEHRFRGIAQLRRINESFALSVLRGFPSPWHERLCLLAERKLPTPRFLELLDADALIEETFRHLPGAPPRHDEITAVMCKLQAMIAQLEARSRTSSRKRG